MAADDVAQQRAQVVADVAGECLPAGVLDGCTLDHGALELERAVVEGAAVEHAGGEALARDIGDHLRALLRDVICGHLDPDLVALADDILLRSGAPEQDEAPPAPPSAEEIFGDARES